MLLKSIHNYSFVFLNFAFNDNNTKTTYNIYIQKRTKDLLIGNNCSFSLWKITQWSSNFFMVCYHVSRFGMKEERLKLILSNLSENFISAKIIAANLGVSSKTIRNDIKEAQGIVEKNGAHIEVKPKRGYRLIIDDQIAYKKYHDGLANMEKDGIPITYDQRVQYLIQYFLSTKQWTKIETLCDRLYISQSSLSQCLKEVRNILSQYNLELISRPGYGLKVQGDEFDVRLCMANSVVENTEDRDAFMQNKDTTIQKIIRILNRIFDHSDFHMSDVSFQNLVMHIYVALLRIEEGQKTTLSLAQWKEIETWSELVMANEIVSALQEEFHVAIPKDESGYIAIHLAAKKTVTLDETKSGNVVIPNDVYAMVSHMLKTVDKTYGIDLMDDLELRMMLALHLVPFGVRMDYDLVLHNPILKDIKTKYTLAYNLAVAASEELKKHYHKEIREDEIGYFALHFNLALERKNKKRDKKNILIVCGTGRGTAQLLMYQFKERFGNYLNDIKTSDSLHIKTVDFSHIDYVITTVPIQESIPVPILEIKTFVEDKDVKTIQKFLAQNHTFGMKQYFSKELFLTHIKASKKEEVLRYMVQSIQKIHEDVTESFYESVLYREKQAVTEFGNRIAIPHPYQPMTKNTFVCVGILDKAILWEKKKVQLIFLMSMEKNSGQNLMKFYKVTSKFLMNPEYVKTMIHTQDFDTLISLLSAIESSMD